VTFQREFWWEREWRISGDLSLAPIWDKILWLCPEDEIDEVTAAAAQGGNAGVAVYCIDPNWGLERIIGHLIGLGVDDLTPFGAS
jgi:hypothetical protein